MQVKMIRYAGAGRASKIEAHIESVRPVLRLERDQGAPRERQYFGADRFIEIDQRADVIVGSDHQMTAGVREQVENDEGVTAAVDYQPLSVPVVRSNVVRLAMRIAEHAPRLGLYR